MLNKAKDDARILAVGEANEYTDIAVTNLVDSAPDAMNTLNELANAINDHQDVYDAYVKTMAEELSSKADSEHDHNTIYYTKDEVDEKVFSDLSSSLKDYALVEDVEEALAKKAETGHNHICADITDLQEILDAKADSMNTATKEEFDALKDVVSGKSDSSHNHNEDYAALEHEHVVEEITDLFDNVHTKQQITDLLAGKSNSDHDHNNDYAPLEHEHGVEDLTDLYDNVYSIDDMDALLAGKAESKHDHDDIYYTKNQIDTEIKNKLNSIDHSKYATKDDLVQKADSGHDHDIASINGLQDALNQRLTDGTGATKDEFNALKSIVSTKADADHEHDISDVADLQEELNKKADAANTFTKDEVTSRLAVKSDTTHNHDGVYAEYNHSHNMSSITGLTTNYYTKSSVDNLLAEYAKVTNVYTKTEIDNLLASTLQLITNAEIDDAINTIFNN